jgi:hypothetical protein
MLLRLRLIQAMPQLQEMLQRVPVAVQAQMRVVRAHQGLVAALETRLHPVIPVVAVVAAGVAVAM